jgi:hypothetical protein
MCLPYAKLFQIFSSRNIILFLILAVGFFFRVFELHDSFFVPETHTIYNGLRLHILPMFNFWDHVSENFIKSFLAGLSGLRLPLSTYVSSTIYGWLGIPLNEFWLRFFYVSLGVLSIIGTYLLGCKLSDYRCGLVAAAILALNSQQIYISRSEGAQITVTFVVLVTILTLICYKQKPTWLRRTVFSILLAVMAGMESIAAFPLIVIYQLMLFVAPEPTYRKRIVECFRYLLSKENIFIWTPCFIALLIHYYVYVRIGMSNVGLFAYILYKRQVSLSLGHTLFDSPVWDFQSYTIYFNPEFFFISLAVFFFLFIRLKKGSFSKLLVFSGVGFFYSLTLVFFTSGFYNIFIFTTLNVLFLASVWISFFDFIIEKLKNTKLGDITTFTLYAGMSLFLMIQALGILNVILNRQHLIHPLKATGYYIREYGGDNPTAYMLLKCNSHSVIANSEYYFGTQNMDMEKSFNAPRQLFCMGSKSIEETLIAYKLKDFDFYVAVHSYSYSTAQQTRSPYVNRRTPRINSQRKDLLAKGVKRVAIIRNNGIILGEIFSRRNTPFKDMEIDEYDPLWDQKYANIKGLVKTKWIGQAGTWGPLWNIETGIQLQ